MGLSDSYLFFGGVSGMRNDQSTPSWIRSPAAWRYERMPWWVRAAMRVLIGVAP